MRRERSITKRIDRAKIHEHMRQSAQMEAARSRRREQQRAPRRSAPQRSSQSRTTQSRARYQSTRYQNSTQQRRLRQGNPHQIRAQQKRVQQRRIQKRQRTKQLLRRLLILAAVLFVFFVLLFEAFPVRATVRVEAGTEFSVKRFLRVPRANAAYTEESEAFDPNVPGTYHLSIKAGLFTHKSTLIIQDTKAPEMEILEERVVGYGDDGSAPAFVTSLEDVTATEVTFGIAPDPTLYGTEQDISIVATDSAGNQNEKHAKVTLYPTVYQMNLEVGVETPTIYSFIPDEEIDEAQTHLVTDLSGIDFHLEGDYDVQLLYKGTEYPAKISVKDTKAPEFLAAESFTAYVGDSIQYKAHVDVTDNSGSYDLEIDNSAVDPSKVGEYPVVYTATDAAGHTTTVTVTLTIAEHTADEQDLFNQVDAILADIIKDGMSPREKTEAIFAYITSNFVFVNDSDKSNYVIAALNMLRSGQGDCYSFFAISKAMLTRAGVKNMDIEYVNRPTREHYWNLVDVEDGHGWYHFDSSPHTYVVSVLLWTDAQLKEIDDGRYAYDPSKYPPIP